MKKRTLEEFIRKEGSVSKAAVAIGVEIGTVFRWKAGKQKPRVLAVCRRLEDLGIRF
ncbi:MAG: hypothetical protein V3T64_09230 [Myxococcota bacterium]